MTLKKAAKAIGAALLYFLIYFGMQFIVTEVGTLIMFFTDASLYEIYADAVSQMGERYGALESAAGGVLDYAAWMEGSSEITNEMMDKLYTLINDIIAKYALHFTVISNALTLLTYFLIFKLRKKKFTKEIGLRRISPVPCLLMVILGAALNIVASIVIPLIPFPEEWWDSYISMSSLLTEPSLFITVIGTVIAAPIVEEVVMRGLVYTRLKRIMPMLAAMLITSWLFGMIHGTIIWVIYASLLGFALVWVYEKYRSLAASIMFHFGFNLCGLVLGFFSEISTLAVIAMTAVSAAVSLAIIVYVQLKAPGKIEFTMPKAVDSPTEQ